MAKKVAAPAGAETTVHTVKVHIAEILLKENPEIGSHYNTEKEEFSYPVSNNIPKEFSDKLNELLGEFRGNEIVLFNPVIAMVNKLQNFKSLTYNPEKREEGERTFIDTNKVIGSINTALTKSKKTVKEPYSSVIKKIDAFYNLFDSEVVNTKNAVNENFKLLIEAREKEKAEKEAAKKQEELDKIKNLTDTNNETNQMLLASQANAKRLELLNVINALSSGLIAAIPELNIEGLRKRKSEIEGLVLSKFASAAEIESLSEAVIEEINEQLNINITNCKSTIDRAIEGIENAERVKNSTLIAPIVETPAADDSGLAADLPDFGNQNVLGREKMKPETDLEKFEYFVELIKGMHSNGAELGTFFAMNPCENEVVQKIITNFNNNSLPQIQQWNGKCVTWAEEKLEKYKESLNSK